MLPERKQAEGERERLISELQQALVRCQKVKRHAPDMCLLQKNPG